MAQTLSNDAVKPQVVMLLHQAVPEPVLTCATGRAHRHLAKEGIRGRKCRHAGTLPRRKQNVQTKISMRRSLGRQQNSPGFRPWLVETFLVDQYDGASPCAVNFVRIGATAGRGRQDRENRWDRSVKSVFIYALCRRWRRRLRVPEAAPALALDPGEGLGADVWAANEFGGAQLGDKRLTARLVKSETLAYPECAINANVESDEAAVNGFYRLIEHPADSEVTAENILAPHRERTARRMRGQSTVLAIQDGTDLNFTRRPYADGLEIIDQTAAAAPGLYLTLAVNGDGLPLVMLRFDKADSTCKTRRWLDGLEDTLQATRALTRKTRVIAVCDRDANCFELFDAQRRAPRVELLVRVKHDRCLASERKLFAIVSSGSAAGLVERLGERRKSSKIKPRPARAKRLAHCELRFCKAILPATVKKPVSAVHLIERNPPGNEDPIQWFLLITVDNAATAAEMIGYYLQRWRVEDFFRVLNSGCRTEFLMFRTADCLQRAIAINAVIAWRIMVMTLRQVPECEPELLFTDHELSFLCHYALNSRLDAPDTRGNAVCLVAHLGGYRGRTPDPGNQIMWQGYGTLTKANIGHRIGREFGFEDGKRYRLEQVQEHVG